MAKKRGKSKIISKKRAKKAAVKTSETSISTKDALHDLEILADKKSDEQSAEIEKKEEEIEGKEDMILYEEKKIEKETQKVEAAQKEIKKEITPKPLSRLSLRDINKGIIGAFIGVVAHFAFIYGRQIAKEMTTARAAVLIIFSYVLIVILMYETGYREVREKRILGILPKRATAIYLTSLIVIPIIFFLFNQLNLNEPVELFKQIAVSSVFASMGAGTADLVGKN